MVFCVFGLRLIWLFVTIVGCSLSAYNLYAYIQAAKGRNSRPLWWVDSNTAMSMFTFIPKAVTQKAVESVLNGFVMGRAVGSAAMSVAKSTIMNRQKWVVCWIYYDLLLFEIELEWKHKVWRLSCQTNDLANWQVYITSNSLFPFYLFILHVL